MVFLLRKSGIVFTLIGDRLKVIIAQEMNEQNSPDERTLMNCIIRKYV